MGPRPPLVGSRQALVLTHNSTACPASLVLATCGSFLFQVSFLGHTYHCQDSSTVTLVPRPDATGCGQLGHVSPQAGYTSPDVVFGKFFVVRHWTPDVFVLLLCYPLLPKLPPNILKCPSLTLPIFQPACVMLQPSVC